MLSQAWSHALEPAQVHDRGKHCPLDGEPLDLVQEGLALGAVALARLLLEELVDVGITPISIRALGIHERLRPCGGVA